MKQAKNFLQEIDQIKFESVVKQGLSEEVEIEIFKRPLLQEYKDKLLAMDTYSEGDAVKISDDFAPHAKKNGKILTKGAVNGTYRVKFEDGEYDIPEHHISRKDAIKIIEDRDNVIDLLHRLSEVFGDCEGFDGVWYKKK